MEHNFNQSIDQSIDQSTSRGLTNDILLQSPLIKDLAHIIMQDSKVGILHYLDGSYSQQQKDQKYGSADIKTKSVQFELQGHSVSIIEESLLKNHGISLDNEIISQLIQEMSEHLVGRVFNLVKKVANENIFDKKYIKKIKIKDIELLIKEVSNMIGIKGGGGNASYMIVSPRISALLSQSKSYISSTFSNNNGKIKKYSRYSKEGSIFGISVLVDHGMNFNDMTVYIGKKTYESEPGIYVPIMNTGTHLETVEDIKNNKKTNTLICYFDVINTPKFQNQIAKIVFKL